MSQTSLARFVAVCVVLLGSVLARAQDLVGLYLTWQGDPTTTMTVNWVNLYPESSPKVFYRELATPAAPGTPAVPGLPAAPGTPVVPGLPAAPGTPAVPGLPAAPGTPAAPWRSVEAARTTIVPSSLQRLSVELTGLSPDTTYELVLEKQPSSPPVRGDNPVWRFRTMPAALTRPVRFVSGGDMMHSRTLLDPMNRVVAALDPDFAVWGGDLAYEDAIYAMRVVDFLQSWMRLATAADRRLIPVIPVIGNHEVKKGYGGTPRVDAPYFYGMFPLPEDRAYYALDFGTYLSFLVLDSGHTNAIDGPQVPWLAAALEARKGQTHIFPVYHYPAFGTAKAEAGKLAIDHPRSVMMQKSWVPLFEQFGVSAVFENDHHTFKRTHPLRDRKRDDATGITYLGDGAWGVAVRPILTPDAAWWLAKAEPRNHVWLTTLSPTLPPKFEALDAQSIPPAPPTPFDTYTPPTQRTPPTPPTP